MGFCCKTLNVNDVKQHMSIEKGPGVNIILKGYNGVSSYKGGKMVTILFHINRWFIY